MDGLAPTLRELRIPRFGLVVLVGAAGSGKSTFAARHFVPTEIVSSDVCRALASDDERDLSASEDAFELIRFIADRRLRRGRLTVVDATNARAEHRAALVTIARRQVSRRSRSSSTCPKRSAWRGIAADPGEASR